MSSDNDQPARRTMPATAYERWMADQEIPIEYGFGVYNVRDVERGFWEALGCEAAFIQLFGMEGYTGMYVAELPSGRETRPQRQLFEQLVTVIDGHGEIEVWAPGADSSQHRVASWQPYSLFVIPLNCNYVLRNTGTEPAILTSVNTAPMVMDLFHDHGFVFDNGYHFAERFNPKADFGGLQERLTAQSGVQAIRANVIKDVTTLPIDLDERRGKASRITVFEMAGNTLAGHLAEWPPHRRQKAHYHAPGAVLIIARSEGYSLMWPSQLGLHPYEDGHEDKVVKFDWREGSTFCPPDQWFHQHFNTGEDAARQIAIRYGSTDHPAAFEKGLQTPANQGIVPTRTSIRHGGTQIEFDDEDPRILADYLKIVGEVL